MIFIFTSIARSLMSSLDSIAAAYSVNAKGKYGEYFKFWR